MNPEQEAALKLAQIPKTIAEQILKRVTAEGSLGDLPLSEEGTPLTDVWVVGDPKIVKEICEEIAQAAFEAGIKFMIPAVQEAQGKPAEKRGWASEQGESNDDPGE